MSRRLAIAALLGAGSGGGPVEFIAQAPFGSGGYGQTATLPAVEGGYKPGDVALVVRAANSSGANNTLTVTGSGNTTLLANFPSGSTRNVSLIEITTGDTAIVNSITGVFGQVAVFRGVNLTQPVGARDTNFTFGTSGRNVRAGRNGSINVQVGAYVNNALDLTPSILDGFTATTTSDTTGPDGQSIIAYKSVGKGNTSGAGLTLPNSTQMSALILQPANTTAVSLSQVFTDAESLPGTAHILDTHLGIYAPNYFLKAFISGDNGESFTQSSMVSLPSSSYWTAYNPVTDRFVAAGNQNLYYSDDGINWTIQNSPVSLTYSAGTYAPWLGKFMAMRLSSTSQFVYTSANGIDWVSAGDASGATGLMSRFFHAPDHTIITHANTSFHARTDTEGVWTQVTGLSGAGADPEMVWTPDGWRAIGSNTNIYASSDGNSFATMGGLLPGSTWKGIAYDTVKDVLVAWGADGVFFSEDLGYTWTEATGDVPTIGNPTVRGYAAEYIPSAGRVVVASDHDIFVSTITLAE